MRSNNPKTPAANTHGVTPQAFSGRVSLTAPQPDRLIRLGETCVLTGLGKTSVYGIEDFPKRVQLSRRAVGWRLSEVLAWIESRVQAGGQS